MDGDAGVRLEVGVQVGLCKVRVALLQSFSLTLVLAEEVIGASSIKLSNDLLNVFLFSLRLLDRLFMILSWLNDSLFLLFGLLFLLLSSEEAAEDRAEWLLTLNDSSPAGEKTPLRGGPRLLSQQLEHIY